MYRSRAENKTKRNDDITTRENCRYFTFESADCSMCKCMNKLPYSVFNH